MISERLSLVWRQAYRCSTQCGGEIFACVCLLLFSSYCGLRGWTWSASLAFTICVTRLLWLLHLLPLNNLRLSGFKTCFDIHRRESLWTEKCKNVWLKKAKWQRGGPKNILGKYRYKLTTAVYSFLWVSYDPQCYQLACQEYFYLLEYLGNQQNGWVSAGLHVSTRSEELWAPSSIDPKGLRLLAPLCCKQVC